MTAINFQKARFLISAPSLRQCPPETGVEVAFAGRSNAGKSSVINCLCGNHKLARTSKTPGRTQLLNYFALDPDAQWRLVDLPGYGYAKVPAEIKKKWQQDMSDYLYRRATLRGLVIVMDIRHPLSEFDQTMVQWVADTNMATHVLLTKADKLKFGAAKSTFLNVQRQLVESVGESPVSCQMFSSVNRSGLEELQAKLESWYKETL